MTTRVSTPSPRRACDVFVERNLIEASIAARGTMDSLIRVTRADRHAGRRTA